MSFISNYIQVHDDPTLVIPFLSQVQQEIHVLESNEVGSLVSYLLADLDIKPKNGEWDETVMTKALLTLKYLGRRIEDSDMLYKRQGIIILMKLAGFLASKDELLDNSSSQEALKCIANCILLNGNGVKQLLLESEYTINTCVRLLDSDIISIETQFLICRILYLMISLDEHSILNELMDLQVPTALAKILTRHVQQWMRDPSSMETSSNANNITTTIPQQQRSPCTLVIEVIKLENIMVTALVESKTIPDDNIDSTLDMIKEQVAEQFAESLTPILDLIFILPHPAPFPLISTAPLTVALRSLDNYTHPVFRKVWYASPTIIHLCPTRESSIALFVNTVIKILKNTLIYMMPPRPSSYSGIQPLSGSDVIPPFLKQQPPSDIDLDHDLALVLSVLTVSLVYANELAPDLKYTLVPMPHSNDDDDERRISQMIFSRLVKILSYSRFPQSKEMVVELLYTHVKEDDAKLIELIGYDYSKPFLITKGRDTTLLATKTLNTNTTMEQDDIQDPVTQIADMTDEEKEREAERLFILFDKVQLQDKKID
ncbi:guanine nucleotide exchange factor [Halteromyces radiatus]|uniref:guanine nucleotide exchange factor n=1 Tax=Halteromyces radiatus TaxID=101107 RepID=UPI00221ECA89|nr:guanine nucleotide exchange factor [Halteromyces radiatus]KAI8089382.1 guanine nucleotide exchange factor [Halteromyces radiatus]